MLRFVVFYGHDVMLCMCVCVGAKTGNINRVSDMLTKHKIINSLFDSSHECKLIEQLIDAYIAGSSTKFTDHLFDYDRIIKLDNWTSTLLLSVKNSLKSTTQSTVAHPHSTSSNNGSDSKTSGDAESIDTSDDFLQTGDNKSTIKTTTTVVIPMDGFHDKKEPNMVSFIAHLSLVRPN